ncbi:ImmA/IrrE family metallo-endopeptidase [Corynebacterium ulcerans]|uniref:ImmA/IrrE family metallo-endopeptidase n=1 Tax=Corynebacterium ulcerans TaxID=65058 RepID=UPI000C77349D|nr:ImmA/IrrE family metallo-endopeptidase [Corynebacterium ulcerans]
MDLEELAQALGVSIAEVRGFSDGLNGQYLHHRRLILLRSDLDPWTRNSALAHELGHAYYGDDTNGDPRLERRADQFAAQILITPAAYRVAEILHDGNPGAIAYELGVTPHLIHVWQGIYERIPAWQKHIHSHPASLGSISK